MDLVQKSYYLNFHDWQLWKQLYGVAMGIHPVPSLANIYLARRIDEPNKFFLNNMEKKEICPI